MGPKDMRMFEVQCLAKKSRDEEILVTGKVDESIVDSVQVAVSILSYDTLKLSQRFYNRKYHFHFADGSFAKEGTSAGLGIALALLQAVGCLPGLSRFNQVLATGEIDLFGEVHSVGGIEMKASLLEQHGLDCVIMPDQPLLARLAQDRVIRVSNLKELIVEATQG